MTAAEGSRRIPSSGSKRKTDAVSKTWKRLGEKLLTYRGYFCSNFPV
jgi:hypothetical protein